MVIGYQLLVLPGGASSASLILQPSIPPPGVAELRPPIPDNRCRVLARHSIQGVFTLDMLTREKKTAVRGDYKRSWMSDDYFDLIVWYERSNAVHGFQLCYDKAQGEHALTWRTGRGFTHMQVDAGEDYPEWNNSPILVPDGSFPAEEVTREFRTRAVNLPKSLQNFVLARIKQFVSKQKH